MNPGRMREVVKLQRLDDATSNTHRSPTSSETYTTYATARARMMEDAGQEDIEAGRSDPRQRVDWVLHGAHDLGNLDRLLHRDISHRVVGVKDFEPTGRLKLIRTIRDG